jgi:hypothetical protein
MNWRCEIQLSQLHTEFVQKIMCLKLMPFYVDVFGSHWITIRIRYVNHTANLNFWLEIYVCHIQDSNLNIAKR